MFTYTVRTRMAWDARLERDLRRFVAQSPMIPTRTNNELAKQTQTNMRMRAPKDTGDLHKSIQIRPRGKYRIDIMTGVGLDRPYDVYQDMGFKPHPVHISQVKTGTKPYRWMMAKGKKFKVVGKWDKPRGFVEPTITDFLIPNAPRIIEGEFNRFMRETFGR